MDDPGATRSSAAVGQPLVVWVLMKWVSLRPEIDALSSSVRVDDRFAGASPADRAALELALRYAASQGHEVEVVTLGPPEAESLLREAVGCGAARAQRVDPQLPGNEQAPSKAVAESLVAQLHDVAMVFCGDWSLDRGSGSVPSYVANLLDLDQACGVVVLEVPARDSTAMRAYRRLDGGRREVLIIDGPAVISVEGAAATLRRAPLAGVLAAQKTTVKTTMHPLSTSQTGLRVERISAHRPPAPQLNTNDSADPRLRVSSILGVGLERTPPMRMTVEPDAAADVIIERLVAWGQLSRD
jgi:electron transfer flavoprotein beta subunit